MPLMSAGSSEAKGPPRLDLKGITKRFPGVLANDHVDFDVMPGEIHALLGENGAGKSTLVKIIYGIQAPDEGQILFEGQPVRIANPRAARRLGIGMVFQHFSLFEAMTVFENIALGYDSALPQKDLFRAIERVMEKYNLVLDPNRVIATLSVGERQRIEIVRALLLNPRLLIMDEPTSVLTPQEVEHLFHTLRHLSADGCSILYISHKLHEIISLCERATILRGGRVVATCDPRQETARSMGEMMIGADFRDVNSIAREMSGKAKFSVKALHLPKESDFDVELKRVNFAVEGGEIFGIAGVAGNGQNELLEALSGERHLAKADMVTMDGQSIGLLAPTERRKRGLCTVPEERNGHAAIRDFTLDENTILTSRTRLGLVQSGFIKRGEVTAKTRNIIETFGVKATGPDATAGSLSGGNLQKFIMGREILQKPGVLIVSQPTWGVDAGAAATIHQALLDLAASGSAIVIISQDLDELLKLCDRLAVINVGALSDAKAVGDVTIEELGLLMGGMHGVTGSHGDAHVA